MGKIVQSLGFFDDLMLWGASEDERFVRGGQHPPETH
jgi:hypothetical protein